MRSQRFTLYLCAGYHCSLGDTGRFIWGFSADWLRGNALRNRFVDGTPNRLFGLDASNPAVPVIAFEEIERRHARNEGEQSGGCE